MSDNYPEFESELKAMDELMAVAFRARIRGDPPIRFVEDAIRERLIHWSAACRRCDALRVRLVAYTAKKSVKATDVMRWLENSTSINPAEKIRLKAALQDILTAMQVPTATVPAQSYIDGAILPSDVKPVLPRSDDENAKIAAE